MKTTKTDFEYFKKRCEYWRKKFQMGNWNFGFWREEIEDARAEYKIKGTGRVATIWLSTMWNSDVNKYEIDKTAFHEVCEILLHELKFMAHHSHAEHEVAERTHMIVRTLENAVFSVLR